MTPLTSADLDALQKLAWREQPKPSLWYTAEDGPYHLAALQWYDFNNNQRVWMWTIRDWRIPGHMAAFVGASDWCTETGFYPNAHDAMVACESYYMRHIADAGPLGDGGMEAGRE